MKLELNDVIDMQSEMLNALRDYKGVLDLPNCNGCAGGLDICPKPGEPLRINCPAFYDKKNGERPQSQAPAEEVPQEPAPDFMNPPIIDSGVCEPAEQESPVETVSNCPDYPVEEVLNCPDDPKLKNYLKHGGSND